MKLTNMLGPKYIRNYQNFIAIFQSSNLRSYLT